MAHEGVRDILNRWIRNRWPRIDGTGERGRQRPELKEGVAAAIVGGEKLVGASHAAATRLGFQIGLHREGEEGEGNTFPASERPGKRPSGRAMADGGELLRRARLGC